MYNISRLFHREPSTGKLFGIGLLSAGIGAAITFFLYGTEKGKEQRERIREYGEKLKDYAYDTANEIEEAGLEVYEDTAYLLKEKRDKISGLGTAELKALGKRIRKHWDEIKEDIEKTVEKSDVKI